MDNWEIKDARPLESLLLEKIKNAHPIYSASVVRGKWNKEINGLRCSECGAFYFFIRDKVREYKFCPSCGARME